ncbi:ABC transporter ATP-binding protein [Spiroplasma gladiatoris]|uniref:ABC transporter ATP-binding protein n=1 Tax=Spiroplasma gladiatoris TaxID=2143 RepID=A0A4P7AKA3_9MOLU|nr:hypothetical protein [Spiroplasma gladiatoris]QBQ08096.1 ABC transporter ATP-binding protein [Spiroplasma gladiatoris]
MDIVNKKIIINELVKKSKENKKTLLIITHDPEVAIKTDKILVIKNGELVETYTIKDLTIKDIENKLLD